MKRVKQLFTSTVLVIVFFGISKVTGLIRGNLVAGRFGIGGEFDAFTAANQLPELFFVLIAGGALAAAFIPVYSNYLTDQRQKEAADLLHSTLSLVMVVMLVIVAISAVLAHPIARLLTPAFPVEQQRLTAELMRIILVQTFLFGISGVLSSYLNAHQHFALPALASVALDIGYVVGLYMFVPSLGIHGLAWGTVVGAVVHILIQTPALWRHRFTYRPLINWQLGGVQEIIRLMGPRIVTLGTIQFADLFIIRLASSLATGSTSAYFYAFTLMQLPETLFGTAIALVIFPTMAEQFNAGNIKALKESAMGALRIIWMLTIPSAVGLVMLGQPAIVFLLQGGAFTADSTRLVYSVLVFFSIRIVSEATLEIVARLFYAQHDTRTPMFAYIGWLIVQVGAAYLLVDSLGVGGLALASTLAFTFLSAVLFVLNRRRLGDLGERELFKTGGRALLGAAGMAAVLAGLGALIDNTFLYLVVGGAAGALTYAVIVIVAGSQELNQLVALFRNRSEAA